MNILVGAFIAIIVGVILIGVITDSIVSLGETNTITNESITITSSSTIITNETIASFTSGIGNVEHQGLLSASFFGNATFGTQNADIDIGEEINFTRGGEITISGGNFSGAGPYNITYVQENTITGDTTNEDVTSVAFFGNVTIGTQIAGIDVGTEVNFTKPGVITLNPTNFSSGVYNITYTHDGASFVANTTARTLLNLIPLFFALAILFIGFMMVRKSFPEMF